MNKWAFPLMSLLLLLLMPIMDAHAGLANLENIDIIAESTGGFNDYFLVMEFGDYEYTKRGKLIPNIESAFLDINGSVIELENLRTKIMGESFVIRSNEILMYALGKGTDQYRINMYILDGTGLNRIPLMTADASQEKISTIKNEPIPPDMSVIIKQDIRTYWKQNYDIEVKVYDRNLNPTPLFHQSLGAIEGADVTVNITDENGIALTKMMGKTNEKGFWEGNFFINDGLIAGGKYIVDVTVSYMGTTNIQTLETFVIAEIASDDD